MAILVAVAPGFLPILHDAAPSWRALLAALSAAALSLALGRLLIGYFRSRPGGGITEDVSQPDSDRLDRLRRVKKGTPTMGGLMIIGALAVVAALFCRLTDLYVLLTLGAMLATALLGAADDLLKLRCGAAGVARVPTRRVKLAVTFALGVLLGYLILSRLPPLGRDGTAGDGPAAGRVFLPWSGDSVALYGGYVAFVGFVFCAIVNAVNLTDGLDGLAAGASAVTGALLTVFALAVAALRSGSGYAAGGSAAELGVLCAALVGALGGFLWYNVYPARIFMGNVGALALGGVLAAATVALQVELLFPLIGAVFVIEAASVLLQVGYFKLTRRRILRCAPFHHHLEFGGWSETRVTQRLWIVAGACGALGLVLFRVR